MAKILLVDHGRFTRTRYSRFLRERGYTVDEAEDGQEALERYQRLRPDVVLLEITLPAMDGIEVVKEIRRMDPQARIVICSAMGHQTMVVEALRAGARDFILKPFRPEKLLASLERLVSQDAAVNTRAGRHV